MWQFLQTGLLWKCLLFLLSFAYLYWVPFTKVEESFNIQATFDLIFHPLQLSSYDHFVFPGVVPRTFIGALLISIPLIPLQRIFEWSPLTCLFVVRATLLLLLLSTILLLERATCHRYGRAVGNWFLLITCSQFHILFYGSRLLPNTFALVFSNLFLSLFLEGHWNISFFILSFTCVVFRFELVLLLAVSFLIVLGHHHRQVSKSVIRYGFWGSIVGTLLSVSIDSLFWKRFCFPEFEAFYFNAIQGHSKQWGVFPFYWYFTHAIPKLLMGALGGLSIGWILDRRTWSLYIISFGYVVLYSCLGHKEVRFIFYVVPLWNICSAVGMESLRKTSNKYRLAIFFYRGLCFMLMLSLIVSLFWTLHHMQEGSVHIDPAAAMTGISRYLQQPSGNWKYSRQEHIDDFTSFDYLITEKSFVENFTMIRSIFAFSQMDWKHIQPIFQTKIFIHVANSSLTSL
ncbi:Dol-P-Man:Man(7)GlcNAc(2)-PP-Dol alpha-1,6-mannosyltransferase [Galdieria sulphuraria]|nr:Dol-P-Man:Man(7)GlcNAc(2)-PP-Dol alpha-1,6-mannosyltransferase [Galdieria sulphuraria]